MRRCEEERENFTEEDGIIFPIQISKDGEKYGFCPGKATWDHNATKLFNIMSLVAETGNWQYVDGGLIDQPDWWIENISWFVRTYKQIQFSNRVKSVVGDGSALKGIKSHGSNRKPPS